MLAVCKRSDLKEFVMFKKLSMFQGAMLLSLRVLVAIIFLWHGVPKAFDIAMAMAKFQGFGLPPVLGPITGWAEVVAGVLVLVGFKHRWANWVLAVIIAGALVTVQIPLAFTAGFHPGLERDLLILVATLLLSVYGPGLWAVETDSVAGLSMPPAAERV